MAWIAAIGAVAGGLLSSQSSRSAARGMQYRPWNVQSQLGNTSFNGGRLNMNFVGDSQHVNSALGMMQRNALSQFGQGQQDRLGTSYLRGLYNTANAGDQANILGLSQYLGGSGQYQNQNFMDVNSGLLSNFDPQAAASNYTNLLRQQAMPQEQQATQSAMSGLFGSGRLGTTGGALQMGQLAQAQQQADIQRQIAGQEHGLQQQLMAQQGYDQARANQQGLMLNAFGANQQGMMNQFNMDQGLFNRALDFYNAGANTTQQRFERGMQLFGGENALNQQDLANFQGLLGSQQSMYQTLMDQARIGASVGQAQTAAGANAAAMRNQGNQDMIAGFMGALNAYTNSKKGG